jgi:hypothetical protein
MSSLLALPLYVWQVDAFAYISQEGKVEGANDKTKIWSVPIFLFLFSSCFLQYLSSLLSSCQRRLCLLFLNLFCQVGPKTFLLVVLQSLFQLHVSSKDEFACCSLISYDNLFKDDFACCSLFFCVSLHASLRAAFVPSHWQLSVPIIMVLPYTPWRRVRNFSFYALLKLKKAKGLKLEIIKIFN